MPKLNHEITLSQDFCWRNKEMMARLTPQQRKMFFAVFTQLDPTRKYVENQIVELPRKIMISFLQCKKGIDPDNLDETVSEGFKAIGSFLKGEHIPYKFLGIKKGNYRFQLKDCSIFSRRIKLKCTFNLDDISGYQDGRKRDNKTIPWLWYVQSIIVKFLFDWDNAVSNTAYPLVQMQNDENGLPDRMYISFDHDAVKSVMGYSKYNYFNIPTTLNNETGERESNRLFFLDYNKFWKSTAAERAILKKAPDESDEEATKKREWAIQSLEKAESEFARKYKTPFSILEARYTQLWDKTQRRVQLFIDKVLKQATEEINDGKMFHFYLMRNLRKPPKRTKEEIAAGVPVAKAIEELSFIRNNYEQKESDHCINSIMLFDEYGNILGETAEYSLINDYKKRKWGQEYTVCIDLSPWREEIQNVEVRKKSKKISKKTKCSSELEAASTSVVEPSEDEDLPFTVGKPYANKVIRPMLWWGDFEDDLPIWDEF